MVGNTNMPFIKQKDGSYKSPSGKKYSKKQIAMYYATQGFKNKLGLSKKGKKKKKGTKGL